MSFLSKLAPSAPTMAIIALRFARSEKRIEKFATFINAKVDAPGITEEQEQVALKAGITLALDAAAAALEGRPILSAKSLRDTTREAVTFLADHIKELDEATDIPFVPDVVEAWAASQLEAFLRDQVIPWIDETQRLQ